MATRSFQDDVIASNEKFTNPNEISLLCFRPEELPAHFAIIVYGQRRTGKTTWLLWLMWLLRDRFDEVVVYSSTHHEGTFQKHVDPKMCFSLFKENVMQACINHQKARKLKGETMPRVLVVMDDVLDQMRDMRRSDALLQLFTQGRHFNISIVVLSQHCKALPPAFRKNVDAAILFRTFSHDMVKSYYDDYGGVMSRQTFFALLNDATQNYQGLVVLPCCISAKLQDYMMLTCAPHKQPDFKMTQLKNNEVVVPYRSLPVWRKKISKKK